MQEHPLSPKKILEKLSSPTKVQPVLILVTGERGAGKTTWCLDLYQEARAAGFLPVGLVSLAVFQSGSKIAINLMDLATGERRQLAVLREYTSLVPALSETTMNWAFDSDVLAWGNQVLHELPASEILILDELGPLEFQEQSGLTVGLQCIDEKRCHLSCVVIRPELLKTAFTRWPWAQVVQVPTAASVAT